MSNSINLTAGMRSNLSSLQSLNKALQTTQSRLSTGKKINSALDDPATFYQASALNQRVSALDRLLDSMGENMMSLQVANAGIEASIKSLEQMKETAQKAESLNLLRSVAAEAAMAEIAEPEPEPEVIPIRNLHDGKAYTQALVAKFGDSAEAAAWCSQYSVSDAETFAAGEWYLPAVGELMDAFGEVTPTYYRQDCVFYENKVVPHKKEIVYRKFDLESNQFVDCDKAVYDSLKDDYYYKRVGSTYSQITKSDYDQFISSHNGRNYGNLDGQYTYVYKGTSTILRNVDMTADDYDIAKDNYFIMQTEVKHCPDSGYEYSVIDKATYDDFIAQHNGSNYARVNGIYSYVNIGTYQTLEKVGVDKDVCLDTLQDQVFYKKIGNTYTLIDKTDFDNFIAQHKSASYYDSDLRASVSVCCGWSVEKGEKTPVTAEEYERNLAGSYYLQDSTLYYNGYGNVIYTNFSSISPDDYANLVEQYGSNGKDEVNYTAATGSLGNRIYATSTYSVEYSWGNLDNYNAIAESLATLSSLAADNPELVVNTIADNKSYWSSSYNGDDPTVWTVKINDNGGEVSSSNIKAPYNSEGDYDDYYTAKNKVRPFIFLENQLTLVDGDEPQVGYVIYDDLSYSTAEDYTSHHDLGKTAVGIITWLSDDKTSARVMALQDISKNNRDAMYIGAINLLYGDDVTDVADFNAIYFDESSDVEQRTAVFDGRVNTDKLIEAYGEKAQAAYACRNFYAQGVEKDDEHFGQGTWYLPAIGEVIDVYGEFNASNKFTWDYDLLVGPMDDLTDMQGGDSLQWEESYLLSSTQINDRLTYAAYDSYYASSGINMAHPASYAGRAGRATVRAFNYLENVPQSGNLHVGDIMYSDLSHSSIDDYDENKTAVGLVTWVSGSSAKIISLHYIDLSKYESDDMASLYQFDADDFDSLAYWPPNAPIYNEVGYWVDQVNSFNWKSGASPKELLSAYENSDPLAHFVYTEPEPEPEPETEPEPEPEPEFEQPAEVAEYNQQFSKVNSELKSIVADSTYNGVDLLNGQDLKLRFNEKAANNYVVKGIKLEEVNMSQWETQEDIQDAIAQIDRNIAALQAYAQELSNAEQMMQIRQNFNDAMRDILQEAADTLVLADMNEETANYLAMQTRQQLAINALALASQGSNSILKLFN